MAMQYKTLQAYNVKVLDATEGIIEAIVSVFNNIDNGDPPERVIPGAFAKTLLRKLPKGIFSHNWEKPIAKTLEARELLPGDIMLPQELLMLGGLYIKGKLNLKLTPAQTPANPDAYRVYSDLQEEIIDEFSIGFEVDKYFINKKDRCIDLLEIKLYEWSPVLAGMNPATQLISVKSMNITDAERTELNEAPAQSAPAIETKNDILGNIEGSMTLAALDSLYCRWWWNICDLIWDFKNEGDPLDEKLANLEIKGAELIRVTVNVIRALMQTDADTSTAKSYIEMLRTKGLDITMQEKAGAKHSADTTKRVNAAIDLMKQYCADMKDCHKDLEDMLAKGTEAEVKTIDVQSNQDQLKLRSKVLELKSRALQLTT